MKETKKSSDKGKKDEKSKYSPFFQSIKGFVSKLDLDLKLKDKESLKNDDSKDHTSPDEQKPVSTKIPPQNHHSNIDPAKSSESKKEENKEISPNQLPLIELFHQVEEKLSDFVSSDRKKILQTAGFILAVALIIFGIVLLFGSADKVLDNVISGERAVTSAFLIIVGLLILAIVLAPRIVGKTSLDNLYREVQIVEDDSSPKNQKDTSTKKEPDFKNNMDKENNTDKENDNDKK
jgi:uncharacterized membrane protein (DUF485 family)